METSLLETGIESEPGKGLFLTFTIVIIGRHLILLLNYLN